MDLCHVTRLTEKGVKRGVWAGGGDTKTFISFLSHTFLSFDYRLTPCRNVVILTETKIEIK